MFVLSGKYSKDNCGVDFSEAFKVDLQAFLQGHKFDATHADHVLGCRFWTFLLTIIAALCPMTAWELIDYAERVKPVVIWRT